MCPARGPGCFPGLRGGRGRLSALVARAVVRESVTVAGRAERARVARAFTAGVLGPGYLCRDDAALLVSELFGTSIGHSGSGAAGQTVTVTVRAAGGVVRVEVTDRGGRGMPQLRPCGSEAEDGRGWGSWRDWPPGGTGGGAAGGRWPSSSYGTAEPPRPAAGPGTGGQAGRAGVHGTYTPGICQVCARHIDGDPERAASTSPAARASASPRAGHCRSRPLPSSAHLRLIMVRELPRRHRYPDMLSRTVINTQDSRLCSRACRFCVS